MKPKSLSRVRLFVTPRNSPGQNTGVGSLSLLQGIYPIQGSNPGLPHCRQILYQLSHQGSPKSETQSVFTPITSVPNTNRFNKYFRLNIPNLPARKSGKIAQAGFKVLLYSFTLILAVWDDISRLVLFQLIRKENTV